MTELTDLNFLSPDSISYSFDYRANGYSRGEGFGVVILKTLTAALRDGDTIRSVIRATGANQDGKTPGITQPSSVAQQQLIRDTYAAGGLDMSVTRFFEAHGTGTAIGDPLEASAIHTAFENVHSKDDPLYIGAVKSNIGHLEGAAGIAGLIKTILVLENATIPPNIWFERPNPKIPAEKWNLKVCTIFWFAKYTNSTCSFRSCRQLGQPMGYVGLPSIPLALVELMPTQFSTMHTIISRCVGSGANIVPEKGHHRRPSCLAP
jgi:acyl transferase domain-containing protein